MVERKEKRDMPKLSVVTTLTKSIFSLFRFQLKMKSFYQEWLRKNNKENREAQNLTAPIPSAVQQQIPTPETSTRDPIPSTSTRDPIPSTSRDPIGPSTSRGPSIIPVSPELLSQPAQVSEQSTMASIPSNDVIFENNQFILFLKKEAFLRQKRFNLQDHLFHVKIKLKNNSDVPFLKDILDFLEEGLLRMMDDIKKWNKEEDANICFLTLFQEPMVNALNSGQLYIIYPFVTYCNILTYYTHFWDLCFSS
jgi:hypothetical protein